jgi:bifunctional non-homologous end joining protein LigD
MQPTQVARAFHVEGWVYEEKVDGYRMVAYKAGDEVRLISRQSKDFTARFPDVTAAIRALRARTVILDGEIAVYDERLVSRFEWLRGRPKDAVSTPPMLMAFDCLQLDEGDLRFQSLRVRRERLDYVLDGAPAVILPVRRLADDGLKAWQEVLERGYEGLVAKDPESPYVEGRTLAWRKVKQPKYREEERGFYKPEP